MDKIDKDGKDYQDVLGGVSDLTSRDKDIQDIMADVVGKLNNVIDLGNLVEGFTFRYEAPAGRITAKLVITHNASGKMFKISESR